MAGPSFVLRITTLAVLGIPCLSSPAPAQPADTPDAAWRILLVPAITNKRVLPQEVPPYTLPESTIKLTACPREYESASFVIRATAALTNVRVSAGDLEGDAGAIPAAAIDIRVVKVWYQAGEWVYVEDPILKPELLLKDDSLVRIDTEKKINLLRMANDTMRDADTLQPFEVPANTVKQCWITVQVPADASAGTYRGAIAVQPQGQNRIDIPIELRVLPFELDEPNVICSMYYRGRYGPGPAKATDMEKTDAQMLADHKDMFAHGVTNPMTYMHPTGPDADGNYEFTDLQRLVDVRNQVGMVGGPFLVQNVGIKSPVELLKATIDFARKNGFTDVYFSAADEASGDALRAQRADMKRVHEAGGKIFVANYTWDAVTIVGDLLDMPILGGPVKEA